MSLSPTWEIVQEDPEKITERLAIAEGFLYVITDKLRPSTQNVVFVPTPTSPPP